MSLYAATKRAGEEIARAYNHIYGLSINGPWGMPVQDGDLRITLSAPNVIPQQLTEKEETNKAMDCMDATRVFRNITSSWPGMLFLTHVLGSFPRRDFLKCTGASIGMEFISSSGPFVETASAADLIQRRQLSEFQTVADPIFVQLSYVQLQHDYMLGNYPVGRDDAAQLSALQILVEIGFVNYIVDFNSSTHREFKVEMISLIALKVVRVSPKTNSSKSDAIATDARNINDAIATDARNFNDAGNVLWNVHHGKLLVPLVSSYRYDYEGDEVNLIVAKADAKLLHQKISEKAYNDEDLILILATLTRKNTGFAEPLAITVLSKIGNKTFFGLSGKLH
ncbi:hypothetical protein ACFE04_029061 [Oxalis oulophora]